MRTKHPRFKRSNNWKWKHISMKPLTTYWYCHRLCLELALATFQLIGSKRFCFFLAMVVRPWRRMRLARQHFVSFHILWGCWLAAWYGAECSQPPAVFSFAWGASKRYHSWQILCEQFDLSSFLTLPLKNTLCLATVGWPSVPWSRPCWTRRRRIWRTWRSSHPDLFEFVQKSE